MITDARAHVAALLTAAGIPCDPYPPAAPTPPCAVLLPGSPYAAPTTLSAWYVALEVRLIVTAADPAAMHTLDTLAGAALLALTRGNVTCGPTEQPSPEPDAGLLTLTIPTTIPWED